MTTRRLWALMFAAGVYAPAAVHANGRFPRAQQIVSAQGDPSRVFLRATFGVLASFDGGGSWRWLCEDAIGFSGTWDPPIAATPDGRLWMGLEQGLTWTNDACDARPVPELAGELVSDLSTDGADVVLTTSTPKKAPGFWRVTRGGARRQGTFAEGLYLDTVDQVQSRAYVTGVRTGERPAPHIFRSDDGGRTWRELHPTWPTQGRLYLASIDPKNVSRVLVRQLSEQGSDLLLSDDGGESFKLVLHMAGAMFGFARSADGATVWAGSGDADEGIERSTDRGRTFSALAKTPVFCLHRSATKLLTCSNPFTDHGYAIGESNDEGATVKPLIGFADVLGPVACDAGAGTKCDKGWTAMHATFTTQTSAPSPSAPPSAAPSASASTATPAARSSCGCEAAPSTTSCWCVLLVACLAVARRQSARPGSSADQRPGPPAP